ncbi:hypothetical protein E3P99_02972 [Wallemia hederae]|uniref:3-phytase n=1 Tax=Wallemia hederae TaxID=1540922 RepID=A0A4T0FIE2_9BASI|nr:hypothetical protein E3P99_02972 [Wallemia hederae]
MNDETESDRGALLPQYTHDDGEEEVDKEVLFDEEAPLNDTPARRRRPKWQSPRSKNVMVAAGCLFVLPIVCLLSPLLALDTLVPRSPEQAHAPSHKFTLTSANPDAGSHTQDHRPWPTNDGFPQEPFRTDIGDIGPTQTGAEAFIVQTAAAYPLESALNPAIVRPTAKDARGPDDFDVLRHLGPLTPYTSSPNYLPTTPLAPDTCEIDSVHMIHRHGSRYPTPNSMPLKFSEKLSTAVKANMNSDNAIGFNGELAFLNEWRYAIGHSILTPVGRWQLYNSGAGFRLKYGHLLTKLTSHKPVFRTTTQDRMFKSAINWLAGFFGVESWQEESHLSILHEARGYNNTLAPWETCPREDSYQSAKHVHAWRNKYLRNAQKRLNKQAVGYDFDIDDVFAMQELCAYETVSLGYSEFCHLFTKEEWEGYDYSWDLSFYYDAGFGSPTARAQGLGWVEETLARLEKKTPAPYDSTTNSTLDEDPVTFPLDMPIYTDFSHDTVIANIVATLNLTQFATPLPSNKIPRESRHTTRWRTSHISPFAGNLVLQVLNCRGDDTAASAKAQDEDAWEITKTHKVPPAGKYVRLALNDAVHDLSSGLDCPFDDEGLCPFDRFTSSLRTVRDEIDFAKDCHGKWSMGPHAKVSNGQITSLKKSEMRRSAVLYVAVAAALNSFSTLATPIASSYAGSQTSDELPTPTVYDSERVFELEQGFRGDSSNGALPHLSLQATKQAYPYTHDYPSILVRPVAADASTAAEFDVMENWGVNMPYKSATSVILNATTPYPPQGCTVRGVTLLQRHAERYPSSWDQAKDFADSLSAMVGENDGENAVGFIDELEFLNTYKYPLGTDKLTSVGRQTMMERGTRFALLYGQLLDTFSEHKMVVRTTTEQRMFASAKAFLAGLFGEEWNEHVHLVQQIEEDGYNSTLNVWNTCNRPDADQGDPRKEHWQNIYLRDAADRLSSKTVNANLTVEDVAGMQDLCAYETIALGYSEFCHLFTKAEWEGYGYGYDLYHYGDAGFGGPVAKASGLGWVQELLARLTNDRSNVQYTNSANSTLDMDARTFPTDQAINIDFTHDVTIAEVVTALNLTHLQRELSDEYIERSTPRWRSNAVSPFAGNLLVQSLDCSGAGYVRVVLNDAVQPLDGLGECGQSDLADEGACNFDTFVHALHQVSNEVDFTHDCFGDFNNTHVVHNGVPE